jgi:hypothetical protein
MLCEAVISAGRLARLKPHESKRYDCCEGTYCHGSRLPGGIGSAVGRRGAGTFGTFLGAGFLPTVWKPVAVIVADVCVRPADAAIFAAADNEGIEDACVKIGPALQRLSSIAHVERLGERHGSTQKQQDRENRPRTARWRCTTLAHRSGRRAQRPPRWLGHLNPSRRVTDALHAVRTQRHGSMEV